MSDDDEVERKVGPAVDRMRAEWRERIKQGFSLLAGAEAYPADNSADARLNAKRVFDELRLTPKERALLDIAAEFHGEHVEMQGLTKLYCSQCGAQVRGT